MMIDDGETKVSVHNNLNSFVSRSDSLLFILELIRTNEQVLNVITFLTKTKL